MALMGQPEAACVLCGVYARHAVYGGLPLCAPCAVRCHDEARVLGYGDGVTWLVCVSSILARMEQCP